jgi:hypothetical protein
MSLFRTIVLAAMLAAGCPVCAQDGAPASAPESAPAASLPEGFSVLERHVEAIGGKELGMKLDGFRMVGALAMPAMGMSGTISIDAQAPSSQLLEVNITGVGIIVNGTNGEKAWATQAPGQPPQLIEGPQAETMMQNANFRSRYDPRTTYTSATTVATEELEGEACYRVELVSATGVESVGLFSVETGLQRKEMTRSAPGATVFTQEVIYSDYREVGGLKFPFRMSIVAQGFAQELTFESIEVDPEFAAGTFDAPDDL